MKGRREFERLLEGHDTAILTTRGRDGHLRSRPMVLRQAPHGDELWFATAVGTQKIDDVSHESRVGVTLYGGNGRSSYLSISGRAEVVRDRRRIRRLWDESWAAWFPDGPAQRDLVLIRVVPEHVEWVRPEDGRLEVLFSLVKRAMHKRASGRPGARTEPDDGR